MTDSQVPIIGWERRYMTPTECSRLQGLDGIKLPSTEKEAYRALGNAVNADVVEKIAASLISRSQGDDLHNGAIRLPFAVG